MTPSDYITEAKYDEETSTIKLYSNNGLLELGFMATDIKSIKALSNLQETCNFIAAAINEKIQREKGEKENSEHGFEVDFSGMLKCKLMVVNNEVTVVAAMNGYGDEIPVGDVTISKL